MVYNKSGQINLAYLKLKALTWIARNSDLLSG